MATSPDLGIPYISGQQAQPEVTHNSALNMLAALLRGGVISITNAPPGAPDEGDTYIVGPAPSGAWVGSANKFVTYVGTAWAFVPGLDSDGTPIPMGPRHEGMSAWVQDAGAQYRWDGASWGEADAASIPYVDADGYAANVQQALDILFARTSG